ncbi:GcrA family cell cycle regulator [Bradyrhizobium sp. CSS354]|uniref:GcrA family cell cycle regulator n=1 Tax=Bradyrhizobium sp. CSS354 TaxID=2699172 RepID=UPI0023B189C2|nr:GcrA family cell cycle regulator [Bradyrhizobium sp. CSS354]MDE5465352.1 GcrA cell cycle regulator [Bradyrhizobium sp. CSS354]
MGVTEVRSAPQTYFSPERVERLKELWEAGLSASQIALDLGGITRNAVIGKVHRLGLRGRTKGPSGDLESIREVILSSNVAPSDEHHKALTELDEATCHWPIDSPDSPEFKFCGAPTLAGLPYCASHARIAYRPASDRPQRPG